MHVDNTAAGIAAAIRACGRRGFRKARAGCASESWAVGGMRAHIIERVWPEAGRAVIVNPRDAETGCRCTSNQTPTAVHR